MTRDESVLCATCGREFTIALVAMARLRHPLWCESCIANADQVLREASQRAAGVGQVLGEV